MILLNNYESVVLLLSIKVAVVSTLMIMGPAFITAHLLATKNFYGKSFIDSLIHLPLILPPVVIGFMLLILLGRNSIVGSFINQSLNLSISFTWIAAVVASSIMAFPLFVRAIRQSIEEIDIKLLDAAKTLGASRLKIFLSIILPLSKKGIVVGSILSFGRSLGEFGATITFAGNIFGETQTIPLAIYSTLQEPNSELAAFRLVGISIFISFAALIISNQITK
jgi:molybdate transport system permease protein